METEKKFIPNSRAGRPFSGHTVPTLFRLAATLEESQSPPPPPQDLGPRCFSAAPARAGALSDFRRSGRLEASSTPRACRRSTGAWCGRWVRFVSLPSVKLSVGAYAAMPLLEQTSTVALPCAWCFCSDRASDGVLRLPQVAVSHRTALPISNEFQNSPGQARASPRRL